jgi:hypothetical protein
MPVRRLIQASSVSTKLESASFVTTLAGKYDPTAVIKTR